MSGSRDYVLVTPVKNEEQSIGKTMDAVVAQTIRPVEWVIASDGSTDGTNEIVRGYLLKYPWIRLLELPTREGRCFSSVVLNTMAAISRLESTEHAYLGLLDADVVFDTDYYENTLRCFECDPRLGLAGGVVVDPGESRERVPRNRLEIPGAVQFFRKECFDAIGGLIAIPEGGWDGISGVMARMAGYRTSLLSELVVDHLKPRNVSQGNVLKRRWQMGLRDFAVGYHPCFEAVKCLSRIGDTPWVAGSFAWWCGYVTGWITRKNSIVPEPVRQHLRHEQIERMKQVFFRSKHSSKTMKISTIPNPETP
ncbi:MAG: glycosyltransferase family A protein [Verrucomicrobia bacterium]|nr:glycosyltransferase family A protein [Verrucomicrobiota bacterium]